MQKKSLFLAIVLFAFIFALPVLANEPSCAPNCPDENPVIVDASLWNEVFENFGDDTNGGYANAYGGENLHSEGAEYAEISGKIDAVSDYQNDVTDNSSDVHSSVKLTYTGQTKQDECGKGEINATGYGEQGTWANRENSGGYVWGAQRSDITFEAEKSTEEEELNFNAELTAGGSTTLSLINEENHKRAEVVTTGESNITHNGDPVSSEATAQNCFGGGVFLGPVSAQFSGNGSATGANSATTTGTGFADIQRTSSGNRQTITAEVWSKQTGSGN